MNTIENNKFKTFLWLICNECINMGTLPEKIHFVCSKT